MPAPSASVFDRLRELAAIEDIDARPTRTIDEVFTGKPLATIPVANAEDKFARLTKGDPLLK